ncbi:MAG: 23S rRNA (adenine(2030)-N(6))-methyltransferase RlmJ [Zoogloeaceae bacterium]|jgi:23S rRNA (adenine2030-N6)-methyltransferase|nr:23S rRNA (adenine(2030)-N(6))-methyltransferase RlmJ [Zoogloeaceae bacterium]
MLSYRHAFHAGNHADVLKHCILVQLLRYLNQKDKPYWFIDTHAGAGRYLLDSEYATKNAEFAGGIGQLWNRTDLPPLLADYVAQVRGMNSDGRLRHYPGSPWLAYELMRPDDRLRLFELHGTDVRLLEKTFAKAGSRVAIHQADGFAEIKSVLPPPPRRALVLIDPAYEDKRDYLRVIATLKEALNRFAIGTYALWYPQLQRGDARELPNKLAKLAPKWLDVRLTVQAPDANGFGMHGSGMFIINPPWTLAEQLRQTLPFLINALAIDAAASYSIDAPA